MRTPVQVYSASLGTNYPVDKPDIKEGDWLSYLAHLKQLQCNNAKASIGDAVAYKRACALAFLGKRAQLHGGVCSRTQPRILTATLIDDLIKSNKRQRFGRYPWLETLTNLLTDIERHQGLVITGDNILALVPAMKND